MFGKNVLVATDFSPCSDQAFRHALDIATKCEGKIHLVHAFSLDEVPESGLRVGDMLTDAEAHCAAQLEEVAAKYRPTGRIGTVRVMLGDPIEAIVEQARALACDLVVVGTHGRRGIERILLGSVAEGVVRTAPCPVLVVRDAMRK